MVYNLPGPASVLPPHCRTQQQQPPQLTRVCPLNSLIMNSLNGQLSIQRPIFKCENEVSLEVICPRQGITGGETWTQACKVTQARKILLLVLPLSLPPPFPPPHWLGRVLDFSR